MRQIVIRRVVAVLVGFVFTAASLLAAPSAALATTSHSVSFSSTENTTAADMRYFSQYFLGSCIGQRKQFEGDEFADYTMSGDVVWHAPGTCSTGATDPDGKLAHRLDGEAYNTGSTPLGAVEVRVFWTGHKGAADDFGTFLTLNFHHCGVGAVTCSADTTDATWTPFTQCSVTANCPTTGAMELDNTFTMPALTTEVTWTFTGSDANRFDFSSLRIDIQRQADPSGGGDCAGVGDMAGGAGMTEVDWGSYWSPSSDRCLSSASGSETISLVFEIAEGDGAALTFASNFCTDGSFRTISVWFLTGAGTEFIGAMRTNKRCADGDFLGSVVGSVPAGAYGLQVTIERWVYQSRHGIFIDDEGGGFSGGGSGDGLAGECTAPSGGWLDLDWFGYIGCVLLSGFSSLGAVVGAVLEAFSGLVATVEGVFVLIGDLPGLIVAAIADAITIDVGSLGSAWSDLQASASGKIPFVWIGELGDVLASLSDAGSMAGAPISFDMTLMGATVDVDPTLVSGPVSSFRPILAGVVWFGLAFALVGQIGGTLGMHKVEGEG